MVDINPVIITLTINGPKVPIKSQIDKVDQNT